MDFDGQTYQVDFSAPGHGLDSQTVDTGINGWYWGNFIFGGALGLLIIDPATGAMWSLPDNVNAILPPSVARSDPTASPMP